ncbi:NAD-dependent epimerase/dehydratase family protein [Alteromonas sp. CYL-A6]|uniref:NAD-dependent epimerase/dehydratase family protein n=1 Tax=Alteromonas nitratireducens TaxID=3390813 RepID=UPI0034BFD5DD
MHTPFLICGHGWLGQHLSSAISTEASISGTTRSQEKANSLRTRGIQAIPFSLGDDASEVAKAAKDAVVILNIPAGRKATEHTTYLQDMADLTEAIATAGPAHVIFISTTSVYGADGEGTVTERSPLCPDTPSAEANCKVEAMVTQTLPDHFSILRLAGLVGPDRHPVKFLAGKTLEAGNKVVNLVYIDDVIQAIRRLAGIGPVCRALHLAATDHPKRGEYYPAIARAMQLPEPIFSDTDAVPTGKCVDPTATLETLSMTLAYPSPYDMT